MRPRCARNAPELRSRDAHVRAVRGRCHRRTCTWRARSSTPRLRLSRASRRTARTRATSTARRLTCGRWAPSFFRRGQVVCADRSCVFGRSEVDRSVAGAHGRAVNRPRLPTIVDGRVRSDAQGMHRRGAGADRRGEIFAEIFAEMRVEITRRHQCVDPRRRPTRSNRPPTSPSASSSRGGARRRRRVTSLSTCSLRTRTSASQRRRSASRCANPRSCTPRAL